MSTVLNRPETPMEGVLQAAETTIERSPQWLRHFRQEALNVFRELGVPTTKNEEWKYTGLREVGEKSWRLATKQGTPTVEFFSPESIRIVVTNGIAEITGATSSALKIETLDTANVEGYLGQTKGEVTRAEGRDINPDTYPFGSLNAATFENGIVLHITGPCEPLIEIVHVLQGGEESLSIPRTLIIAEPDSQAKIVESYICDGEDGNATIPVTEVFVGEGSNIEHVRAQMQSTNSTHIGLWQTRQKANSTYSAFNVCYGAKLARLDQTIWIEGEGCITRLDGVVCASGDQHIDNHTRLDHAVPNCNSFEIYKQIIDGQATVVFNGKIFVHQDAQKTDAKQTNQALLLSPKATINSKPQLEIFADDVKCTHGATVGQLEDLPMFYMRSRGVSQSEAQAVLVYAFAAEVLEMITIEPVRKSLEKMLYEKLGVNLSD